VEAATNEKTLEKGGLPAMSLDVLVPLAWTCWAILFGAVLVGTVWMARDAQPTPEVGPGFGCLVIAVLYILVIGAGGILYTFTKSQSQGGVFTMAVLLGFVVIMLIAQPSIMAYKQWSFERGYARVGEFREPALHPLAEAIRTGDSATLRQLLGGKKEQEPWIVLAAHIW
jgi:hypothetical protein